jgi:hypothetical protein
VQQPEPFAYIVAHALKLVGEACGGFLAQRRQSPSRVQSVQDRFTASPVSARSCEKFTFGGWRMFDVSQGFGKGCI